MLMVFLQAMNVGGGGGENYGAKKGTLKRPLREGNGELRGPKMTS